MKYYFKRFVCFLLEHNLKHISTRKLYCKRCGTGLVYAKRNGYF